MGSHWKLCSTSSAGLAAALLLFGCNLEQSSSAEDSADSPDSLTAAKSSCHPAECTPGFTSRGDISPLAKHGATHALFERLKTLDCSPHSVPPLQVFAEADPRRAAAGCSSTTCSTATNFQPNVFTTLIQGVNDTAMLTAFGRELRAADHRRRAPGARAQARSADRSRRHPRVHRRLHRHLAACSSSTTRAAGTRAG